MTEQEFKSRKFGHSQPCDIINSRTGARTNCLITAVDFDNGTLRMWPIPPENSNNMYLYQELWVSYEFCFPPVKPTNVIELNPNK